MTEPSQSEKTKRESNLMSAAESFGDLPSDILDHLPFAEVSAKANMARVDSRHSIDINILRRHIKEANSAKYSANRIQRLRYLAGEWGVLFSSESACATGCSHCCNIDVTLSKGEAKVISKAIGVKLDTPEETKTIESAGANVNYEGKPCVFLVNNRCAIYAHRPIVCRTLVNMDSVDILCKIRPGITIPVPYANSSEVRLALALESVGDEFADIREWFPAGLSNVHLTKVAS